MESGNMDWVFNCLANELRIDDKCVPFSQVELEVKRLLRTRRRTPAENVQLAVLYQAMKDHLEGLQVLQRQMESSQSYLGRLMSWWRSGADASGQDNSSGASVVRRRRRRGRHHRQYPGSLRRRR